MSRSLNGILWYIKFYKIFNFILLPIIKFFKKTAMYMVNTRYQELLHFFQNEDS